VYYRPRLMAAVVLALSASLAFAGPMLVRVGAHNYSELKSAITFKGTSIDIAGAKTGESYDLLMDRADFARVQACGLPVTVVYDDVDTRKAELVADGQYQSYDEIKATLRTWASSYPNIVMLDSIGPTYGGRYIYAIKISDNPTVQEDETEVLLDGQHHAREWAAGQAAMHFADTIIHNYATNSAFQNYVDSHQTWVIPIVNVDGFVYDYPGQLYWRKNRQPFGSATGSDPNRDYNGTCSGNRMSDWGSLVSGSRTANDPNDETWMGARGAWGLEVAAMNAFFKQHTFVANPSMHSYSELILWPYGDGTATPDQTYLQTLGQGIAAQMAGLHGGTYTPERSDALYPSNCISVDWVYGWSHYIGGFPCASFTFELGTDFYQPAADLNSIERECFDGLWYLFNRSDSIGLALEGTVPRPVLAVMDSSATGDFTLHWTPTRPEHNHPDQWEVEELSGLTVNAEGFESGLSRWVVQGASASTTQKHAGTYSAFLGTGNNISNYIQTADPYPVHAGDSLTYWIWYNVENNYDVTVAEVSLEGKEWFQLHDRFTGNSSGWQRKAWSLEPWVGKSVFIRFRYMTDDGTTNAGVYIDDVSPVPVFATHTTIATGVADTLYDVTGKAPGQYWYRARGHNAAWGWGDKGPLEDVLVTGTGIAQDRTVNGVRAALSVEPNPGAGRTSVRYALPTSGAAAIAIYDASGRLVRTMASGRQVAGEHTMNWDGRDASGRLVPAGVYHVRMTGVAAATTQATLVR
jgi:hypothetical protein